MAYGKYGDNHYQCGFGAHDGGDSCQYDTRKEKRKIILRLRVRGLRHEWSLSSVLLEVFSAIGTVGMSAGITRGMGTVSRIILIVLMYCGRIGSMTFALSFTERKKVAPVQLPAEKIIIG